MWAKFEQLILRNQKEFCWINEDVKSNRDFVGIFSGSSFFSLFDRPVDRSNGVNPTRALALFVYLRSVSLPHHFTGCTAPVRNKRGLTFELIG